MVDKKRSLSILYLNTYGQTKFTLEKQLQLESLIQLYSCDIVHLQETQIDSSSFEHCTFIKSNYNVLSNNSLSGYGTASLVQNSLQVCNEKFDANGRVFVFDIENTTFCNVYLDASTDSLSRANP